ncbi:MAG: GGDEF domain-containing protein [Deltaproteobacteria bacterium HGW-Deltaproteobacteria-8]|jgi:diguanylate cyclase (GGDEF)-like protein|nr:MAG: GGDEF domain-containing protein [Deltaproteobacteria bacterium HGW-Deltaproteobacteria-8]
MSRLETISRLWRKQSITIKFACAFSLLFALLVLEALVGYGALGVVLKAEAEILSSVEIRQRVFKMDGELEKARRMYRDFFLTYSEIGFAKAHSQHFLPAKAVISRVVALSDDLRKIVETSAVSVTLRERNKDIALYLSSAQRFGESFEQIVDLVTILAAPESGLLPQLEQLGGRLDDMLRDTREPYLLFLAMDRHRQEYLNSRQRPFLQMALNSGFNLEQALGAEPELTPARREKARKLLRDYLTVAGRIPDVDVKIRGLLNDFTLQAQAVDPISRDLKALAALEVDRARARINAVSRVATVAIVVTALIGLGFALVVAALIHATVTRKIVALTQAAGELRADGLEARPQAQAGDEISALAATFQGMVARMQDLVANLESKVDQRTQELAAANDKLEQVVRELDEKNQALEVTTRTDRLTGLANRRRLEEALQTEVLRARRYGKPFSVILLDIDHFKKINDQFGHQAGDNVLIAIAGLLTRTARETDVAGRYGGEEFLLVCPETVVQVVAALAERLRVEFTTTDFPLVGQVTSSFGVAEFIQGDSVESLVERADQALYRAKGSGRNCVEVDVGTAG